MNQSLGTILTAMVTPFTADLALNEDGLAVLTDHLLDNGSDGLVVAGTTGESPTLSVALTRAAEAAGVDAVLLVTPYYNKPPARGMLLHFRTIAAATSLPVIVYNIPSRCVVDLPPELLAQLAETENIVAVKQANPDLAASRRLLDLCDLQLYAGNDDMLLPVAERAAATVLSLPLYAALSVTTNPIMIKAALALTGRDAGGLRPPLVAATADEAAALTRELKDQGLL